MHPIFQRPARLLAFLGAAAAAGLLLSGLLEALTPGSIDEALELGVPLTLLFAFQCLATWYPARAWPVDTTPRARLVGAHAVFAVSSLALWLLAGGLWASALAVMTGRAGPAERFAAGIPVLAAFGLFAHVLAVLIHYLVLALDASRRAERRVLEARLAARDAELKSLRAQLSPHFLFNSLNSVSALAGSDPPSARRMCLLLAGFFRKSLALGARTSVALDEELFLAETYLAIEEVRFGPRLRVSSRVDGDARGLAVPPLLLQPLVENAIHHGIAHLVEGGEVIIEASARGGELRISVENPCDPDRPGARGEGVGLRNVRARLEAAHGDAASVSVQEAPGRHRVELRLPAIGAPEGKMAECAS
jgi:two-component system, LytTR family, sensor histidine kinase AlgZ